MRLEAIAREIRAYSLRSIHAAGSGHPGGCLSVADILAALYFEVLNARPAEPGWKDRDRVVLSKGHSCPALYAALALRGYFPVSELVGLRKLHHFLQGHPDIEVPGVDAPSGSLGMGLSQGLGFALGARYLGRDFRAFVILGDGDMQEGNTWEAIMAAGHFEMGGLVAVLDANGLQGEAPVAAQLNYFPVLEKLDAFGWDTTEISGHDQPAIVKALEEPSRGSHEGRPRFIVAHTTKGKGVSFMENSLPWHGSVEITDEQLDCALRELGDH
jgi:transketolase